MGIRSGRATIVMPLVLAVVLAAVVALVAAVVLADSPSIFAFILAIAASLAWCRWLEHHAEH